MEILTKEYFEELEKKILKENYSDFLVIFLRILKKKKINSKRKLLIQGRYFIERELEMV